MNQPVPDPDAIDLSNLISLVNAYVLILAREEPEIYHRLVVWALYVLQADGRPIEVLLSMLDKFPAPARQWWLLRQFLTPAALSVLLRHLQAALLTFERNYDQEKAAKTTHH